MTSLRAPDPPLAPSPPPKSPAISATAVTRSGRRRNPDCWSNLPLELLLLVFERLGFADFERAKSVCSPWQSASRISQPSNQIPWMILFPKNNNYCLLFNPEENDKVYKTQDLGNDFAKSFCVATYRSWLLMQPRYKYMEYHQNNLYILDLLTSERINLPTFESQYGLSSSTLWIDEKTKDYFVIGMNDEENPVFAKKGDNSWKQIPQFSGIEECFNMVYKDHKLYCLNYYKLNIFDCSREIPIKIFKISVRGYIQRALGVFMRVPGIPPSEFSFALYKNNLVVTVGGDILIVRSSRPSMSKIWNFEIYKMDSSKGKKWEEIVSLGDEAIILELGITVLAKNIEGIKRNSIYFNGSDFEHLYDSFIFNLDTKKVEQPHQFVCSSVPCYDVRWFLPSFKRE